MGQEVQNQANLIEDLKVVATVDPTGRTTAHNLSEIKASSVDGVIDFSQPAGLMDAVKWCAKNRKFLVSGTTGLSRGQLIRLKAYARRTPILWSANMSLGVAALKQALSVFSGLDGFDFQIEEIHHKHKVDAPSGTALDLQEKLKAVVGKKNLRQPMSIRAGGVRGIHRVLAIGEGEVLTFEHVALDRSVFAAGAIKAALWLASKKPGFYNFEDLWR